MMKKSLLITLLCLVSFLVKAQSVNDGLKKDPYKDSQWYVGLNVGANYSLVNVINDYNIIQPTNLLDASLYEKEYKSSMQLGVIYGLSVLYQFEQRLVLGTGLQFNDIKFSYEQSLANNSNSITFVHDQNFRYLEVPVFFRFMIRSINSRMWNRTWRKPSVPAFIPYIQFGLNIGILTNADKDVEKFITNGNQRISDISFSEDVTSLLSSTSFGAHIGFGARYRVGNAYLTAEVNVKQTITNLANENSRFANENLVNNAYDVYDDMNTTSFSAIFGIIVPIKYLNKREFVPVEL